MVRTSALAATAALALLGAAGLTPAKAQAQEVPSCPDISIPQSCPTTSPVDASQANMGDVSATITIIGQNVVVVGPPPPPDAPPPPPPVDINAEAITSSALAAGNNLSERVTGAVHLRGRTTQWNEGSVSAVSLVQTTGPVPVGITSQTLAYGNTAQAQACCGGMTLDMEQFSSTGSIVADAQVVTAPGFGTLNMITTAATNVIGLEVTNGPIDLRGTQVSSSNVRSTALGTVCCNDGSITVSSTGLANGITTASVNSTIYTATSQNNHADVLTRSAHITNSGTDIVSATQATANSMTTMNQWGYTQVDASQAHTGTVSAVGELTANAFRGRAAVGATATGNSILMSSQGSDGTVMGFQTIGETGGVGVYAGAFLSASGSEIFNGSGGVGTASAMAVGNAITGYACSSCGSDQVKLEGYSTQINGASVVAQTDMRAGVSGVLIGTATATGNSATFITQPGGH